MAADIIRRMAPEDWPAVERIYLEGIDTGNATFETRSPGWDEWNNRHLQTCRLVAVDDSTAEIYGWAALTPYSSRRVYAGVAQVSIYIAGSARGKGIGKVLLTRLIEISEAEGIWTLEAGIFPENSASLLLHQGCGFHLVGRRVRIGKLKGIWRDVLLLERRSSTSGS